jgi:hypothetical protein
LDLEIDYATETVQRREGEKEVWKIISRMLWIFDLQT